LTVMAKRTFWEKVTILHKEAFRATGKFPNRYSRHYYDLYCMEKTEIKEQAYKDLDLLNQVVLFKSRFYPTNAARYDLAKPGTMKLLPSEENMIILADDYEHMRDMIFGEIPSFTDIIKTLKRMETEINRL